MFNGGTNWLSQWNKGGNGWMAEWNKAKTFSLRIGEICAAIPLPGSWEPNDRIALAVASFELALEHHSSIHLLLRHNKCASANALARPLLEAALRTTWLAEKASEKEISGILKGRNVPILGELNSVLSSSKSDPLVHGEHEGVLHCLTHGGSRALVAQYNEGEERERANAVIAAQAGFSLGSAGYTIAHHLGQQDFVTQLVEATPIPIVD
ncbi:DUF6988 family protein [Edaphobacter modestus]|uniref:Uncharacterized protein n=1 Tax=Edaphobacter modestus TaxID=388466 RepID=A0A4Q7YR00_9BACT|nr:hypothetical protein [Edaphobacter modestus]RZU40192.1 hypothetical protein BDD14_1631 [Edaphobacter modestus]